jgi:GNAT superfamily N-acetyltransferase
MTTGHTVDMHPVTPDRWSDLERLFGARGACGGCWCMWWRLSRAEFGARKGDKNKRTLRRIVASGSEPGVLAYEGAEPIGWCAVAPRTEYPALERSRVLSPVDDTPVWSITCLFIAKAYRRRGLSSSLIDAASMHAARHGARMVEGYPVIARTGAMPDAFAWTGLAQSFVRAGFTECARRSPTRPIMRRAVRTSTEG